MTYIVLTPGNRGHAVQSILDAKDGCSLTIKAPARSQSDAQRRLSFLWYADVGRQLDGWTSSEARAYSKLHIGVRLLRDQEPEFREAWDRLILDRFNYDEKLELMLDPHDYPVTRIMKSKQMSQYMDEVYWLWTAEGVRLTDPEARKYEGAA